MCVHIYHNWSEHTPFPNKGNQSSLSTPSSSVFHWTDLSVPIVHHLDSLRLGPETTVFEVVDRPRFRKSSFEGVGERVLRVDDV